MCAGVSNDCELPIRCMAPPLINTTPAATAEPGSTARAVESNSVATERRHAEFINGLPVWQIPCRACEFAGRFHASDERFTRGCDYQLIPMPAKMPGAAGSYLLPPLSML